MRKMCVRERGRERIKTYDRSFPFTYKTNKQLNMNAQGKHQVESKNFIKNLFFFSSLFLIVYFCMIFFRDVRLTLTLISSTSLRIISCKSCRTFIISASSLITVCSIALTRSTWIFRSIRHFL